MQLTLVILGFAMERMGMQNMDVLAMKFGTSLSLSKKEKGGLKLKRRLSRVLCWASIIMLWRGLFFEESCQ